ncbi:MAG: hypothetical protein ACPGFB_02280 [Verrucomicrobiales bacterium]
MNFAPAMDPTPEERFIDAALHEQARLGQVGNDDELVAAILTKTILDDTSGKATALSSPRVADRRLWIASAVAAVAVIAVVALGLSSLPYRSGSAPDPEMQFSVRLLPAEEVVEVAEESNNRPTAAVNPHGNLIAPNGFSTSVVSDLDTPGTYLEITTSFAPSFASFPERPVRRELFSIASIDESSEGRKHTYSGNVRIEHQEFLIEANAAEVSTQSSQTPSPEEPYLVAYDVILTQFQPARQVWAGKMTFDPGDSAFILTGVRQLKTSEGDLTRFQDDDRIILTATSLSIKNSPRDDDQNEVKYANPLSEIPK